jgi:hypothetical protein
MVMDDLKKRIRACGCAVCRRGSDALLVEFHKAVNRVLAELNERDRRLLAGLLADRHGYGGIQRVTEITGLSRKTIRRGCREIGRFRSRFAGRIRRPGGGRQRLEKKRPGS